MKTNAYYFSSTYLRATSLRLIVLTALVVLTASCRKEENEIIASKTAQESNITARDSETLRIEFAKSLVQALQAKEVREFLKEEALQKYDGDYDVLYALVKDKKLTSGETFEQALSKYTAPNMSTQWAEAAPLMTIFIPTLESFTPETWNANEQIPDVVIDNNHLEKKDIDKLIAFSSSLNQYEVSSKEAPTHPVVVVKENERIVAKNKFISGAKKEASLYEEYSKIKINENNSHSFYFIGDQNPRIASKQGAREAKFDELPYLLYWGAFIGYVPVQRDWIYYYIRSNDDRGTMANYAEYLRGFKLSSPHVLEGVSDRWTEGLLEFHITLSFIYRDGSMQNDLKVFYCGRSSLMSGSTMLDYNPNVELMPWNMERYGDEWKFTVLEHDPGGSVQTTVSTKSTFGNNFAIGPGGLLEKIGISFGASLSVEKSNSKVVTISSEADQLGSTRLLYTAPVLLRAYSVPGYSKSMVTTNAVGTGAVDLSIEPVAKSTDTRPIPD